MLVVTDESLSKQAFLTNLLFDPSCRALTKIQFEFSLPLHDNKEILRPAMVSLIGDPYDNCHSADIQFTSG